jgi:hypothetical protein
VNVIVYTNKSVFSAARSEHTRIPRPIFCQYPGWSYRSLDKKDKTMKNINFGQKPSVTGHYYMK